MVRRPISLLALGATCASALLVAACEEEPPPSTEGVGQPITMPQPRELRVDPLYDADGVPLPSDERVAGLVLPRGLEEVEALREERRHVYDSRVPTQKMLRYFGPRLITVEIDRVGERVTYRNAVPRGVRGGVVRLDVTIEPTSASPTRVTVYERPPPPPEGTVVSDEAIREYFDRLDPSHRE